VGLVIFLISVIANRTSASTLAPTKVSARNNFKIDLFEIISQLLTDDCAEYVVFLALRRDNSVCIATSYRLGSIPGTAEIFLYSTASRPVLRPTQRPSQLILGGGPPSLGVKRLESEAGHSHPSSAKIRSCGAISPLPHTSSWRCA
jgi:hypothetical protein